MITSQEPLLVQFSLERCDFDVIFYFIKQWFTDQIINSIIIKNFIWIKIYLILCSELGSPFKLLYKVTTREPKYN